MPRGRPLKEDAKRKLFRVRMTDEEYYKLKELAESSDRTCSDVIRDAIELLYEMANS